MRQTQTLEMQKLGVAFYLDEILYKLMHWSVTSIFVFTSIRLGYLLKIEKLRSNYREAIMVDRIASRDSVSPLEDIKQLNEETQSKLEQSKARGDCVYTTAVIYCSSVAVAVVMFYIGSFILRR